MSFSEARPTLIGPRVELRGLTTGKTRPVSRVQAKVPSLRLTTLVPSLDAVGLISPAMPNVTKTG